MNFSLNDFTLAWNTLLWEGLPFLILGALISGAIDAFVPARLIERLLTRDPNRAVPIAGAMGLLLPLCECAAVPVIRRLILKGLHPGAAISYMLASPIVNPITFLSTFAAYKAGDPWLMASSRLVYGYVLAVGVGLILSDIASHRWLRPEVIADRDAEGSVVIASRRQRIGWLARCVAILRCSLNDFLNVGLYFVIGSGIAAFLNTAIERSHIVPLASHPSLAILTMMAAAVILCLCSTSDAFIAATFVQFPLTAQLSFLVLGPMVDIRLLALYRTIFSLRALAWLALGLSSGTFLLCWLHHLRVGPSP